MFELDEYFLSWLDPKTPYLLLTSKMKYRKMLEFQEEQE
jgi:hypothetical protein